MCIWPTYSIAICICLLSIFSSSDSECGKSGSCQQGYVYDGLDTCRDEFPWNAALVESETIIINEEIQIFCGASIITTNFLISAGHCFKYRKGEIDRRKDNIRAYIGLDNRLEPNYGSDYKFIESVDIYPEWLRTDRFEDGYDLAIIKVATPIEFSPTISPICLPSIDQRYLAQVGRSVKMAGFGSTASSKINGPQNLLKGHFKIVDCREPNNICAAETENGKVIRDTCNGDSGGGLVAEENGSHILVGVVSWGRDCGDSNFTTRYVNVLDHLQWIKTKIEVCFTITGSKCILPFRFQRNRYNECITSSPSRPDKTFAAKCPTRRDSKGEGDDFEYCNQKCPGFKKQVHGNWQTWSSWTRCSGRCQSGVATRYRNCSTPQFGGHSCIGKKKEEEQCNRREECEKLTTSVRTTDIDSITSIAQTSQQCSDTETCETRANCPYVKDKYAEIQAATEPKQRKLLIDHLKSKVCNKEKKGFCCIPETCGTSPSGGTRAWPWAVLLTKKRRREKVIQCAGTLISGNAVLAAAHCVDGRFNRLQVGNNIINDIGITEVIRHPAFKNLAKGGSRFPINDIAIIKLNRSLNDQPACLPDSYTIWKQNLPTLLASNPNPVLLGWTRDNVLEHTLAPVVDCTIQDEENRRLGDSNMCTGDWGNSTGICNGNIGGALMSNKLEPTWSVVGIMSFRRNCEERQFGAVFTRVDKYLGWIKKVLND